ncbi:hypothetical protein SAMN05444166_8436 [Singulisphaera sp. GP187]|uniref:hypothetical protein n=1 Tax=Singulisphaera sp. GP187 TaxID=1882752 RepID=UPI0009260912|nr:hypothetical protein [Singulisphaera sp. GP187]SIO67743.1 hypothetical protein SAMN05444166_8436 [Singulisphaera sp. GP187]
MNDIDAPGYQHTQKGPWSLVLYGIGVFTLGLGLLLREEPLVTTWLPTLGVLLLLVGACFQHLTVTDEEDRLDIRFGPLPLFRKQILYEDMRAVEVGRTTLLDGWGIHLSLRGGWVWNIAGWDCVIIHHRGKTWVGTDDAENLARFLKAKISQLDSALNRI